MCSYFLNSAPKSPRFVVVGMLSCAASTPDSTDPWSLYDTLFADIPSIWTLSRDDICDDIYILRFNAAALLFFNRLKEKETFTPDAQLFSSFHADTELWAGVWSRDSHMTAAWRRLALKRFTLKCFRCLTDFHWFHFLLIIFWVFWLLHTRIDVGRFKGKDNWFKKRVRLKKHTFLPLTSTCQTCTRICLLL